MLNIKYRRIRYHGSDIRRKISVRGGNLCAGVLSLLPLIENVVEHNTIDSEHPMTVHIGMSAPKELMVRNALCPKLAPSRTNGTGLNNLQSRFQLLIEQSIQVDEDGTQFMVKLPLE